MAWIKAKKNGNAFEVDDVSVVEKLVLEGHEAFESDPRVKGAKKWDPDGDSDDDND